MKRVHDPFEIAVRVEDLDPRRGGDSDSPLTPSLRR
jgi:hypothetical protein